jgi:hypothetical protein
MAHGWRDGLRALPHLPHLPATEPVSATFRMDALPADERSASPEERVPVPLSAPPAETPTAGRLSWLMTPRMKMHSARAMELIRGEEEAYWKACAGWQAELSSYRANHDVAAEELTAAKEHLEQAQRPLTDTERMTRRLAEQDKAARPDGFVSARRQTAWERRLHNAEQAYQATVARHAEAARKAQLYEELMSNRLAIARAAARCHYEHGQRRIATYLQQLVRTHRHGRDLNMLLMTHPVGPQLPAWAADPATGVPPGGRRSGELNLGEETSTP